MNSAAGRGTLEDGGITPAQVAVTADYLREGFDQVEIAQGHRSADAEALASAAHAAGRALVEAGTCLACHQVDGPSIGPSYVAVAQKYEGDPGAAAHLAKKVREGGAGVWGEVMMPPHPQLSETEVQQMVAYILSLDDETAPAGSLPVSGTYTPPKVGGSAAGGAVVLRAAYTDRGANGLPGASAEETLVLRAPTVVVASGELSESVRRLSVSQMPTEITIASESGSYVRFEDLDLTGISEIRFAVFTPPQLGARGGTIEVRLDAPDGPLVGETDFIGGDTAPTAGGMPPPVRAVLTPTEGARDVYLVFRNDDGTRTESLFLITTAEFVSARGPATPAEETAPTPSPSAQLSTHTPIQALLDDDRAKAVLEKHVPGLTTNPQLQQALQMSLREVAAYAPQVFTAEVLDAIDADLAAL